MNKTKTHHTKHLNKILIRHVLSDWLNSASIIKIVFIIIIHYIHSNRLKFYSNRRSSFNVSPF